MKWVMVLFLGLAMAGCVQNDPVDLSVRNDAPPEPTPLRDEPEPLIDRSTDFTWDLHAPKPGQLVSFRAASPNAVTLTWDFDDGSTDQGADVFHVFKQAGIYNVQLTAAFEAGPDASAAHVITVASEDQPLAGDRDPPVITWTEEGLGLRFGFTWNGTPDDIGWDFGDGTTSQGEAPLHVFPKPGTYTVRLNILEGAAFYTTSAEVPVTSEVPVFSLSDVGRAGEEPSIGVTSDGCAFFVARRAVMKSCDFGATWTDVSGSLAPPIDNDPYLWVDTATDRVFRVNMLNLVCTQIGFTDDGGASWIQNPVDCGPLPVNDHIKLGTGPWTSAGYGAVGQERPVYDQAVYFCYNKLAGAFCYTSFDGGLTFPIGGLVAGLASTAAGLHGAIETAPDGTVYVPPRTSNPSVLFSKDHGLTWQSRTMGGDAGTPDPRKNSEAATDTESNAYHVWIGADFGLYMSRSTDSGLTWDTRSTRISPDNLGSTTFPHIDAGDPGRIAIAYLATPDHNGNPHTAPDDARYHLYVTFSLNALDDDPQFTTVRATTDPVQIGSICIDSGDCVGGNRNLLDFNDMHIGPDGRVYIAYADGCTGACATHATPTPSLSRSGLGSVAILEFGPSLYADVGQLEGF